jgi:hypothetical protein
MRPTIALLVCLGVILFAVCAPGQLPATADAMEALASPENEGMADDWWSLLPLVEVPLPDVKNQSWTRTPIDYFILATLERSGLTPAPEVDRATFIRRATFDLHGLPPTPEEIDAFLLDTDPNAFEKLIDRLLASPRYGERWGRHWLDIAHYADTHGYDKDKRRLWAWLFRDWIIRALNRDLPYRRFVRYQLAGDVLYSDDLDGIIATGFVVAGPWDFVGQVELREGTVDKEKTRVLDRDDMVATTISTFCSTTAHCARCHNHKFDPIPQKDYYRLQAVFAGVERGDRVLVPSGVDPRQALEQLVQRLAAERNLLVKRIEGLRKQAEKPIDPAALKELATADSQIAQLQQLIRNTKPADKVYAVVPIEPRPIHLLQRGEVERKGELMTPGALSLVPTLAGDFKLEHPENEGSRRAALAEWITDDKNVLTWRSIVNRVWQYHFGKGLVDTPNDFGRNGSQPTHPELLDWLAVKFRDGDQSLKKLHKLIMLSAAYRQSSGHHEANAKIDADNRYLWRMHRNRLDAESIRDSVLAISGKLNNQMYGPGFELFRYKEDESPIYDHTDLAKVNHPDGWRRTVYRFVPRSVPNPFLESLDCADPNINTPVRNTTLTSLQALALLNNPFVVKQAEFFAERVKQKSDQPQKQIEEAYRLAFGRPPTARERELMVAYVRQHGLANACRLLFNANEFQFID